MEDGGFPNEVDVTIVGAGVHGIACYKKLKEEIGDRINIVLIDPKPPLMNLYHTASSQGMEYLRSPITHHLGEKNYNLDAFAKQNHYPKKSIIYNPDVPEKSIPSLEVFKEHSLSIVRKIGVYENIISGTVTEVGPHSYRDGYYSVRIYCNNKKSYSITSKVVIFTIGLGEKRLPNIQNINDAIKKSDGRISHIDDISITQSDWNGKRVLVVGGGQSGATVSYTIAKKGGEVVLISREDFSISQTEVDPIYFQDDEIERFKSLSLQQRSRIILGIRSRGNITPDLYDSLESSDMITLSDYTQIKYLSEYMNVVLKEPFKEKIEEFDIILFATGYQITNDTIPIFSGAYEKDSMTGLPLLTKKYRLKFKIPYGKNIFISGKLAMLQGGPAAVNIGRANATATTIANAIKRLFEKNSPQ